MPTKVARSLARSLTNGVVREENIAKSVNISAHNASLVTLRPSASVFLYMIMSSDFAMSRQIGEYRASQHYKKTKYRKAIKKGKG